MNKRKILSVITAALLLAGIMSGCNEDGNSSGTGSTSQTSTMATSDTAVSITDLDIDNMFTSRDLSGSYDESEATAITCENSTFTVNGSGAAAEDNVLTISQEGVYIFSGTITDGRIVVEVDDTEKVQIVLNNFTISCSNHAPIFVKSGDKVFITLADGTENYVSDGEEYTALADDESNVDSAIFSKSDLTINGTGSLTVEGNMSHAIVSKDDLVIASGNITATSSGNAICGKDSVRIADGTVNVTSGGDGIKSNNTEDTEKGYIYIEGGTISITSETDGIQAETLLVIAGGNITLNTGGGSENASADSSGNSMSGWGTWGGSNDTGSSDEESSSAKGLKAGGNITVTNASVTADTSDDSIHSGADITIESGTLELSSGDDGIHADSALVINGGTVTVSKSYEGLEGSSVTINGGDISIVASDDGINAAGGSDSSSMGGRPGENSFNENSDVYVLITGGELYVNAGGDGLDSNSTLTIEGGTIYVDGPSDSANGAIDYETSGIINGGTIVAVGSSGMAESFNEDSEQASILYNFSSSFSSGDTVTLTDSDGNVLVSYTPSKSFNSVVVSAEGLDSSGTYTLTVGDESVEIEMTSTVYSNGGSMGMSGGFGGGGMGGGRGGNMGHGNMDGGKASNMDFNDMDGGGMNGELKPGGENEADENTASSV